MRIIHIIPNLSSGGAERFVVDLANEMAKSNDIYLCTLFALKEGENDFFSKEVNDDVRLISLNKKLGLDLNIFVSLSKLIKEIKPDIVHTHLSAINYVLPVALTAIKIKFFHTIHNDATKEVSNRIEFFTRKIFYKFKFIYPVTISQESKLSYLRTYQLPEPYMVYNGRVKPVGTQELPLVNQEISKLKKSPDTLVLINVGRILKQKNQLMLVQVVNRLIDEGFDLTLLIIGSDGYGEESRVIKNDIENIKRKNIHLLGQRRNVIDYLLVSDAFCLSSLYEGLPISLIEAMAVGCIPICTPVGGIPEIIGDTTLGFVSESVTEQSYYEALKKFVINQSREEMKENLINKFNTNFDISKTSRKYNQLYSSN